MKNVKQILNLIVMSFMLQAYSQQYPVLSITNQTFATNDINYLKKGNYAKDTEGIRDQIVGSWRYATSNLLFEIIIEKQNKKLYRVGNTSYDYKDIIVMKYKLVKNGVVLHDNLSSIIPQNNTGYHNYDLNFISYGFYYDATYTFKGFINDYYRQVLCSYEMQKTNLNGQEKLLLNISNGNYRIYGDASMYTPSQKLFSLPLGPILLDRVP